MGDSDQKPSDEMDGTLKWQNRRQTSLKIHMGTLISVFSKSTTNERPIFSSTEIVKMWLTFNNIAKNNENDNLGGL